MGSEVGEQRPEPLTLFTVEANLKPCTERQTHVPRGISAPGCGLALGPYPIHEFVVVHVGGETDAFEEKVHDGGAAVFAGRSGPVLSTGVEASGDSPQAETPLWSTSAELPGSGLRLEVSGQA